MNAYALPVVAVEMDGQKVIINENEFDAATHKLWVEAKQEDAPAVKEERPQAEPEAPKRRGRQTAK